MNQLQYRKAKKELESRIEKMYKDYYIVERPLVRKGKATITNNKTNKLGGM